MPELLRTIAGRLRAFVADRRSAPRFRVRVACSVSLHDPKADASRAPKANAAQARPAPSLECRTRDLSATGLSVVAPAIRIGGRYLTESTLRLRLEHKAGAVEIVAQTVHYDPLPPDSDETGYLIGLRIVSMSDEDRARYADYLS